MDVVSSALAVTSKGLEGDRAAKKSGGRRQITLVQAEDLLVIARLCGIQSMAPEQLRRNLVISDIDLMALMYARFAIGAVLLEGSGPCAPCLRLEQALGRNGRAAMTGRGGITARVIQGGVLALGDRVRVADKTSLQAALPLV